MISNFVARSLKFVRSFEKKCDFRASKFKNVLAETKKFVGFLGKCVIFDYQNPKISSQKPKIVGFLGKICDFRLPKLQNFFAKPKTLLDFWARF